jgi:threonylcarbamoyladenosine tRNA methylthiotransferase MtaB
MKRVALHTLGCKLNFAETSTLGRQFLERGFRIVAASEHADVYLLNTCSVTERADREARQIVRRFLRKSPGAYVIVVGCYAQLAADEIAAIDGVDVILGADEKFRLFEYVNGFKKEAVPKIHISDRERAAEFRVAYAAEVGGRTRAFLKIQDGCDFGCSFCTIPLARGESRSASVEQVVREAREIARRGYREIVLTGVNVGDYGRKDGSDLMRLLDVLQQNEGIERIRISSIEPNLLTPEIVDYIVGSDKVCNHFHIPLQSGSDSVLKRMRRRCFTGEYRELIDHIRSKDPDAGIGADVIVGFPGETESLFDETYRFLLELPVTYLHVFSYSERENTPALRLDGSVQPKERQRRSEMLRILGRKKRYAFASRFLDRRVEVLFEEKTDGKRISGLTSNYIRVSVPADELLTNEIRPVWIREVLSDECLGELAHAERHVDRPTEKKRNLKLHSAIAP